LGVLGLIATSEIIERYRKLNKIQKSVDQSLTFLESRFTDRPSALAFFQPPPILDGYIKNADHIDICGVTLTSTVTKQFGNLRERLQSGAKIRIMLIAPDSVAIQMTAERSMNPKDLDYYRLHIQSTMRELAYLQQSVDEFKHLGDSSAKNGSFSVRLMSYAPSFSIDSFDANRHDGVLFVELYPHKFGYKTPPIFELMPQCDGDWYRYFIEQFDQMWNAAQPWDPNKYIAQISAVE
jgi:hypothetical protein